MRTHAEVIVVGAGPSGCAAALGVARRGHDVLVLDRMREPADKVCGEGLMPHGAAALARLGAGVPAHRPFVGIAYHAGGHVARAPFPGGRAGLGVRRSVLDRFLVDAVLAHPRIEVGTASVRGVDVRPGDVRVATDSGGFRGRALVAADGRSSTVRRSLRLDGALQGPHRFGVRGHLRVRGPVSDHVEVWADQLGELYVTPLGDRELNVAVLCDRAHVRDIEGDRFLPALRRWPDAGEVLAGCELLGEVRATGPLRRSARDVVADSTVLVGDAAGFVDAVTGEGMSLSLLGAELAAEVLSRGLSRGRLRARDLRPYAVRRHRLGRDRARLTELVLAGLRRPQLAAAVVRVLESRPELLARGLAVATGERRLWRLVA